jgi:hypothetical protein
MITDYRCREEQMSMSPERSQTSEESEEEQIGLHKDEFKEIIDQGLPIFKIQRKECDIDVFERYSRKEKSLGQLSRRFLEIFGGMTD